MKALLHKTRKTLSGQRLWGRILIGTLDFYIQADEKLNLRKDVFYGETIEDIAGRHSLDLSDYELVDVQLKPFHTEPIPDEVIMGCASYVVAQKSDQELPELEMWQAGIEWYKKQIGRL